MNELIAFYRSIPGKMITFDLTGHCNMKCTMCVWHNGKKSGEDKRHLSFESFARTVDELVEQKVRFDCINLSVSGEPLLHPQFRKVIEHLFRQNERESLFGTLSINTNMVPLIPKTTDFLLTHLQGDRGRMFLTCSINSATPESGFRIKKAHFHENVLQNTRYLIRKKAELGLGHRLKLDLQMLILEENAHEAEIFVQTWSREFESFRLKYAVVGDIFCPDDNVINLKREFDQYRQKECDARFLAVTTQLGLNRKEIPIPSRYESSRKSEVPRPPEEPQTEIKRAAVPMISKPRSALTRTPCPALWQTPIVRSSGDVSFCLSDIDGHMEIGNIHEKSFLSIWLGEAANRYRGWHLLGKQENISVCSHCTYYEANQVPLESWSQFGVLYREKEEGLRRLAEEIFEFKRGEMPGVHFDFRNGHTLAGVLELVRKTCNELLLQGVKVSRITLQFGNSPISSQEIQKVVGFLAEANADSQRLFSELNIDSVEPEDPRIPVIDAGGNIGQFGNLHDRGFFEIWLSGGAKRGRA